MRNVEGLVVGEHRELMLSQILPNLESRVVEQYDVPPDRDDGQS